MLQIRKRNSQKVRDSEGSRERKQVSTGRMHHSPRHNGIMSKSVACRLPVYLRDLSPCTEITLPSTTHSQDDCSRSKPTPRGPNALPEGHRAHVLSQPTLASDIKKLPGIIFSPQNWYIFIVHDTVLHNNFKKKRFLLICVSTTCV